MDNTFEKARAAYGTGAYDDATLEFLFPQLKESEDERIRKAILGLTYLDGIEPILTKCSITAGDIRTYLEKQKEQPQEELVYRMNGLMQEYIKEGKDEAEKEHRFKCYQLFWDALEDADFFEQKEQKPILEVFGFKVGDAVRLKNGDGRKHIIKSFEEVEGIHGPNFYHVEFEDNSARDGIYPGKEYPNGYYTQMEKFEKEQKPSTPKYRVGDVMRTKQEAAEGITNGLPVIVSVDEVYYYCTNERIPISEQEEYEFPPMNMKQKPAEWSEEDYETINDAIKRVDELQYLGISCGKIREALMLKSLRPQPQMLEDWTSEDDELLADVLGCITLVQTYKACGDLKEFKMGHTGEELRSFIRSLKSRPRKQPHWKPSEEQMEALDKAIPVCMGAVGRDALAPLESLYEQLKAL